MEDPKNIIPNQPGVEANIFDALSQEQQSSHSHSNSQPTSGKPSSFSWGDLVSEFADESKPSSSSQAGNVSESVFESVGDGRVEEQRPVTVVNPVVDKDDLLNQPVRLSRGDSAGFDSNANVNANPDQINGIPLNETLHNDNQPIVAGATQAEPDARPSTLPGRQQNGGTGLTRRKQGVIAAGAILVIALLANSTLRGQKADAEQNKSAPKQAKVSRYNDDVYRPPVMGAGRMPMMPPPPAPEIKQTPPPEKVVEKPKKEEVQSFVVPLNDEKPTQEDVKKVADKEPVKEGKKEEKSPLQGFRIPMLLLEPFRTGIATTVTAQVTADIKDMEGNVTVPAGSICKLAFLPYEANGRVLNDNGKGATIFLPNGSKLPVKGMVKGGDGFAGISGKVIKFKNGNFLSHMGRALGRVASSEVSAQTGGLDGQIIDESVNEGLGTNYNVYSSSRVVELKAGTPFFFEVAN
jgi:hypothetical protein